MQDAAHKRMSGTFECGFGQADQTSNNKALRTQLSTDFGFKEENESPRIPPTPFAPFLHLDSCEFLELEPDSPESLCSRKHSSFQVRKESRKFSTAKVSSEKDDGLSNAQTNISSNYGADLRDEDSEDEGVAFGPLNNPSIQVWAMNDQDKTVQIFKNQAKEGDSSRKGLSIMDLLKSKRPGKAKPSLK